jgi:hypothetical protein
MVFTDANCFLTSDLVPKVFASQAYPVPGMTNENYKNISARIAGLCTEFLNLKSCKYTAEIPATLSQCLVKDCCIVHM